jgi:hypothetical protein
MSWITRLHGGGPSGTDAVGSVVGDDASGVGVGRVRFWQAAEVEAGVEEAAIID